MIFSTVELKSMTTIIDEKKQFCRECVEKKEIIEPGKSCKKLKKQNKSLKI